MSERTGPRKEGAVTLAVILVVDDDPNVVGVLTTVLPEDGHSLLAAGNGRQALDLARTRRPDLAIVDIMMPELDGLQVLRELRQDAELANMPVILLTGCDTREDRVKGLDQGADDYIGKPFDVEELKARVRAVLRRTGVLPGDAVQSDEQPSLIACGVIEMDLRRRQALVNGRPVALTPTEFALLRYFVQHPDRVFTADDLLGSVWEYPDGAGDPGLVRWHIRNLRAKIEAKPDEPLLIVTVGGHGYMLASE